MFFINLTKHQIKRYIFRKNIGQKESFVPFFSTKLSFCLVNNLKIMDYFYDVKIFYYHVIKKNNINVVLKVRFISKIPP